MKKTLEEWEKAKGRMVPGAKDPKKKMTEEEFEAIPFTETVGVNFDDRTKFLKANGYEVNRENMVDRELGHKEQ